MCCSGENPYGKEENNTLFLKLNRVEFGITKDKPTFGDHCEISAKIVNNTQLIVGGEHMA